MLKLFLLFLFIPFVVFSQSESTDKKDVDLKEYKDKEIVVIGYKYIGPNSITCPAKAVRITVDQVIIDTCYSTKTKEISNDIIQSLYDNDFYLELLMLTKKDVMRIQADLDNFNNEECDVSSKPILVILTEKNQSSTFGLKQYLRCFPKKSEVIMKRMNELINSIQ